jgi:hypothetical protein
MYRVLPKRKVKKLSNKAFNLFLIFSILVPTLVGLIAFSPRVNAAVAEEVYIRLDRVKASETTGGLVCFRPGATATIIDVNVTFPGNGTQGAASFGVNSTASNWTVTTTNLPNGASAWTNITTASAVSGATVTFDMTSSASLTQGTLYCFNFTGTSTLTNPSSPANSLTGSVTTRVSGPTNQDTGSYALSIISEDQITVSATVPAIFTLALSGSAIAHGTLTAGTVDTGSVTATLGTNAADGWISWVRAETTAALSSVSTGANITSPGSVDNAVTSLSGGTYGWVLDVILTQDADGDGTISQAANYGQEYDGNGTSGCTGSTDGGTLATTFQPVAASNGTSDNEQIELCSLVRVAAYQEAATDYTQDVIFTAAGRF